MEQARIVIAGAGPAGIATAVEAREVNIDPVVILEKKDHPCDTIASLYHKGKRVDPVFKKMKVEPIGRLSFETETKEEFLERMNKIIKDYDLDIRYFNEVRKIIPGPDKFKVISTCGLEIDAPIVVVAIGVFGKPVKPRYPIPSEIKDKIFFNLPQTPIQGKKVLVVGGGDSAAETACFLSKNNDVTLSYRRAEFFRLNPINKEAIDKLNICGKINLKMATDISSLESAGGKVLVHLKNGQALPFDAVFYCLGGSTPWAFLEGLGVNFHDKKPEVDEYGETNIPRLFLAGDLLRGKGSIMAAFNSAKKVIDGVLKRYGELVTG